MAPTRKSLPANFKRLICCTLGIEAAQNLQGILQLIIATTSRLKTQSGSLHEVVKNGFFKSEHPPVSSRVALLERFLF